MKKLYAACWLIFTCLVYLTPTHEAFAYFPRGFVPNYANLCGSQPVGQMWCVSPATGYTVFTASTKTNSGTACSNSGSTTNETCIVLVSQSLGSATCAAHSSTTIFGKAQPTSADWASISDATFTSLACQNPAQAQSELRLSSADWMLFRRGDTWNVGLNGASGSLNSFGSSNNTLLIIGYGGTGARPYLLQGTSTDYNCLNTSASAFRGQNIAFVGIHCNKAVHDPASAFFQGATITADTTAGSPTLSNINAGAGLPSQFFTTASYSLNGNGINNLTPTSAVGAASTSITMNGNAAFTATQMKIQIQDRQTIAGLNIGGVTNTLIVEDCEFDYGGLGNVQSALANTFPVLNINIRRNVFNGSTSSAANLFLAANCPATYGALCVGVGSGQNSGGGGQVTIEENISNYGGWNPNIWAYPGNSQFHTWYLHDPSVPVYIHGNVVGNGASDNQYRDCGTAINNLFYANSLTFAANVEDNPCSISYNVSEANGDNIVGIRTATASPGSSGTVLSVDGIMDNTPAHSLQVGALVVDLSNPGAIPNTTTIVSVKDGFSVNLSASITVGIRGNGVQPGDTIQIFTANGTGITQNAEGTYVDNGPVVGNGQFPIGSTLTSVTAAIPSIANEPSTNFARSQDEPFQFTSGTLPTGLSLNTTYCADPANGSATAYPFYLPTNGICNGGADLNTTGSNGTSIPRTGSRKFKFSISEGGLPAVTIPPWVTADVNCSTGSTVFVGQNAAFPQTISGLAGGTTAQFISSDRTTLVTCDASILAISGSNPVGDGQNTFLFNVPNNPNYPTSRIGPNNLFIHLATQAKGNGNNGLNSAISWQNTTSGNNGSGNYVYYWNRTSTTNNFNDVGFPGTNLPALASSQVLNCGIIGTPCGTIFPNANTPAYDAANNGSGFNGTVTGAATFNPGVGSSYDGATLTVNSGVAPAIGDTVFCSGCTQFMTVVSGTGPFTVTALSGTMVNVGPVAMTNGSFAHFISQALTQNSQTGWNPTWTAAAANNYMRSGQPGTIPCGNQTTFPGSPACPQVNWLLERDINPASNDNSPVGMEKAA